jgi:flagellar basal body-associated protein FliL
MDNDTSSKSTASKWIGILLAILLPIATALLIVFLEKKSNTNQTSNYIMTTIPPNQISITQSPTTLSPTSNTGAAT